MSKARSTFDGFIGTGSGPVLLHAGDEYDSEHPVVQGNPALFEVVDEPRRPVLSRKAKDDEPKATGR